LNHYTVLLNDLGFNPKIKLQKSSRRLPVHGEPVQGEPVWAKSQTKIQKYFLPSGIIILETKILATPEKSLDCSLLNSFLDFALSF